MEMIEQYLGPKPLNLIIPTALFVLLAPGFLVSASGISMPIFHGFAMPSQRLMTHAVIFLAVHWFLRKQFAEQY